VCCLLDVQGSAGGRSGREEDHGGPRTADTGLMGSSVPEPDLRQRTAATTQDLVALVDEARPRLRSRRDGRMSAAGRLAEQAAEAAAAAGWAADGTLLVVRARWRCECSAGRSIICWTCTTRKLVNPSCSCSGFLASDTSCLGLSQADGRGATVSLAKPRTDANTDSSPSAAPAEAPLVTVAAGGSRQDAGIGGLISSSTSAARSRDADAAARPGPSDGDAAEGQFAAQEGRATATLQQGSRRAGTGLQKSQSLPQAGGDAPTTWQAELASALRTARTITASRAAQDERRLTQTALALLPAAVVDYADE